MKGTIYFLCMICFLSIGEMKAQEISSKITDEQLISIKALIWNEDIPLEARRNLETRLQRALTLNGFADNDLMGRFVLVAKVNVLAKDIMPITPMRISQKLEITFMVGDVVENKLYETSSIVLSGIGINETKAFVSAFSKINPQQEELRNVLYKAKTKIVLFYIKHCDEVLSRANTLANMQKYDEGISLLLSVPNVCSDCYNKCQENAIKIYKYKVDKEGHMLLNRAKNEWARESNSVGAHRALLLINQISPHSSAYGEIKKLQDEISQKLQADEQKEWDFQVQKYQDNQVFKRNIVDAVKAIGVAWGNGQPQNVTKTIIRDWW